MRIEKIVWDEESAQHIFRHGVSPDEVEDALFNPDEPPVVMRGKEGKYLAYGTTSSGKLIFIVFVVRHRTTRVVTAREMAHKEKQFFKRKR